MTPSGVGNRGGGGGVLFQASDNLNVRGLLVEECKKVGIHFIAVCERTQRG